jgi:hypothetical protein
MVPHRTCFLLLEALLIPTIVWTSEERTVPETVFCSITDKWIALGYRTATVISLNDVANGQLLAARHEAGRSVYFGAFSSLIRL